MDDRVDEIMCRSTDRPRSGASDAAELREKRLQEWFNANTKYEDEVSFLSSVTRQDLTLFCKKKVSRVRLLAHNSQTFL